MINKVSQLDRNDVFYLASPYSHPDKEIMRQRYEEIDKVAAELTILGLILLEPIASCHPKSLKHQLPSGYKYWQHRDRTMIERSDGVIVATMPGWRQSVGVTDEIEYAISLGKPVYYLDPRSFRIREHFEEII